MSTIYMDRNVINLMKKAYQKASQRIIFIDYDGTLIPFSRLPEEAVMTNKADSLISQLSGDAKNKIVIISGRDKMFLDQQFNNMNVTLVAEHGFFTKEPQKEWKRNKNIESGWKSKVILLLKEYVDKYEGSFIEEKHASLAWHYRNVDRDFAEYRMNEVKNTLLKTLRNDSMLEILIGNKVLEIKSSLYNKGSAALRLLNEKRYNFIMAIGDDKTDEDLFKAIPGNVFTLKIGISPSVAQYYINQQEELYKLFRELLTIRA